MIHCFEPFLLPSIQFSIAFECHFMADELGTYQYPVLFTVHDFIATQSHLMAAFKGEHGSAGLADAGKIAIEAQINSLARMLIYHIEPEPAALRAVAAGIFIGDGFEDNKISRIVTGTGQ